MAIAFAGALAAAPAPARAQTCQVLHYTFQPDCLRGGGATCVQVDHVNQIYDFGPQIAVWVESADRSQFIDTLMVTNMVAARGIGNRPGLPTFVSSPKFPYGKRQMALPIWAYTQGKLYPSVVFQDTNESQIGFHESCSSPDPYYCRPMLQTEIVDAISCPTPIFNSSKGRIDPNAPPSYYPPRNDLPSDPLAFIDKDCDTLGGSLASCTVDAAKYADDANGNGLDAVAAATPPYGRPFDARWYVPANLPAGDYALMVEVNKEFDVNASHMHQSTKDPGLVGYGLSGNFGQPSVVYRVPIRIDGSTAAASTVTQIAGYSSWLGDSGTIIPRDDTISSSDPGSGEARLLEIDGTGGLARVHVTLEPCACVPAPPPPAPVSFVPIGSADVQATSASITFQQGSSDGSPVFAYEIRYGATNNSTMSEAEFMQAIVAPQVDPLPAGATASFTLENLKPDTHYVVGIRSKGPCELTSDLAFVDFSTVTMKFTQLSGCFVATAAYGSAIEPEVAALRALRDQLRPRSALFAAATEIYYRSGPAAAAVISRSETARAVVRRVIGPVAGLAAAVARLSRPYSN
jgi:hypothetical protein